MQSILLISHGEMANGVKNALTMFFGKDIPQLESLALKPELGAEEFGEQIRTKLKELESDEGTVIFADLLGGTPFNQAALLLNDKTDLIVGVNLPMLMEFLATREYDTVDVNHLVEVGKQGVANAKVVLGSGSTEEDY
ncbi:MAG: PTS sugar transporter subunit IIA [Erysipelotrichaceae bacterium]|nr:PTS sugar transporter subunit IIA [Erysipelotrichaceae bacterium]